MSENLPIPIDIQDIVVDDLKVSDNFLYGKTPVIGYVLTCADVPGNAVWAAGSGGSYLPLAGGTMAGNIAMGSNNVSGVGRLTATNLVFSNIIFPYAPITSTLTSQIDFFGDSVMLGTGLATPATERWSALLCTALSKTENNLAIGGDQTNDMATRIYGTSGAGGAAGVGHIFDAATGVGNSVFIQIGVNDIRFQNCLHAQQQFTCLESLLLWCCLPAMKSGATASLAKLWDTRDASVTKTGTTSTIPVCNIGTEMKSIGATISRTVNGRYVIFTGYVLNGTSGSVTARNNMSVTIDGVVIQSSIALCCAMTTTANGASFSQYLYLYDTGSAGTGIDHTLLITKATNTGSPSTASMYVNWLGAFDPNPANCSTVVLCSPSTYDFYVNQNGSPLSNTAAQEMYFDNIKNYYSRAAARWRTEYGLPIYYCDMSNAQFMGLMSDSLHPNTAGHNYLYSRVNNVLTNGSYAVNWGT